MASEKEVLEAFTRLRASCDELLATLNRIAHSEAGDIIYTPPEYALEIAHKRGRAAGFARSAQIAEDMLGTAGKGNASASGSPGQEDGHHG